MIDTRYGLDALGLRMFLENIPARDLEGCSVTITSSDDVVSGVVDVALSTYSSPELSTAELQIVGSSDDV